MPKVSVVVPVYRVEEYLDECIASVLGQTFSDFELILVDDGSPDNSIAICEAYAVKDTRVRIVRKENGGLSSARNAGVAVACGEYVFYLDSDDWLESTALERLVGLRDRYGADVVIGNYVYSYGDREEAAKCVFGEVTPLGNAKAMEALADGKLQNFAWGKLIRADIAKSRTFPVGRLFEDHYWAHLMIGDAETVVVDPECAVHYRQRGTSISYTMEPKRLDMIDGWICRKEYFDGRYPELTGRFMKKVVVPGVLGMAWLIAAKMKNGKKKTFERLRNFCAEYGLEKYASGDDARMIRKIEKGIVPYTATAVIGRIRRRIK